MNPELPKIKEAGLQLVEKWMIENGYSHIQKEPLLLHDNGLKARGTRENILVQVRTFQQPGNIFKISDYETDILTRRALKLELVAYVAYVILSEQGEPAGEIQWERIG
jgi:hypothetical protein